jgi:hypothetical protein
MVRSLGFGNLENLVTACISASLPGRRREVDWKMPLRNMAEFMSSLITQPVVPSQNVLCSKI